MEIKAVIFDVGGVLIQICHDWAEALAVAKVDAGNEDPRRLVDFPPIDAYQQGDISYEEYLLALADYLQIPGKSYADKVHRAILKAEYPGMLEIVNQLNQIGKRTLCLSNTAQIHWEEMFKADRFPAFSQLKDHMGSHIEMLNKPSKELFQRAESRAGAKGKEIVFFDDHLPNIEGALNFGWDAVQVNPKGDVASEIRKALIERDVL